MFAFLEAVPVYIEKSESNRCNFVFFPLKFSVLRFNGTILTKVTAHSYSIHLLQTLGNSGILIIAYSFILYTAQKTHTFNFNNLPAISFACSFSSEEIAHVSLLQVLATS